MLYWIPADAWMHYARKTTYSRAFRRVGDCSHTIGPRWSCRAALEGTTEGPQCNDSCRVWYGRCNKERIDARRRGGRRQFVSLRAMRGRFASGSASGDFPLSFDWPKEFLPRFRSPINARVRKRALVKLKYQFFSVWTLIIGMPLSNCIDCSRIMKLIQIGYFSCTCFDKIILNIKIKSKL